MVDSLTAPADWSEKFQLPITVRGLGYRVTGVISERGNSTVLRLKNASGELAALKICSKDVYSIDGSYSNHGLILRDVFSLGGTPGLVRLIIFGSYKPGGGPEVWWELLELASCSLAQLLRDGSLDRAARESIAGQLVAQIGQGLTRIGNLGVVHNDIKPSNVVVFENTDGTRRFGLCDWEVAHFAADPYLPEGKAAGTEDYLAWEAAGGSAERRSDWYSLGALLVEVLTGVKPTRNCGPELRHCAGRRPFTDATYALVEDDHWRRLLRRMTEPDPNRRDATMQRVVKTLGGSLPADFADDETRVMSTTELRRDPATQIKDRPAAPRAPRYKVKWPVVWVTSLLAANCIIGTPYGTGMPPIHTPEFLFESVARPFFWIALGTSLALLLAAVIDHGQGVSSNGFAWVRWRPLFTASMLTTSILLGAAMLYIGEVRIPPQLWVAIGISPLIFTVVRTRFSNRSWAIVFPCGLAVAFTIAIGSLFLANVHYRSASDALVRQQDGLTTNSKCHRADSLVEPRRLRIGIKAELFCSASLSTVRWHIRATKLSNATQIREYQAMLAARFSHLPTDMREPRCTRRGRVVPWQTPEGSGLFYCKGTINGIQIKWTNIATSMHVNLTVDPKRGHDLRSRIFVDYWRQVRAWSPSTD